MNYDYNNLKEDEHVFHMWEVMNFNITDKYKFIKRNFIFNLISNIIFIPIGILLYIINKVLFGFEVIDKRKIIRDSGFVSVSNHIHPMDCTMIGLIYYPKRVYYPTIERNFKIPFIRHLIRLLYAFPIPQNKKYKDNFYKDINNVLNNNKIIQMYPEGSMWPYYENVRHFKMGAFKMAVDANKPIQPIKFLFEENNGIYSLYKKKKCIVAKVLDPIYPNNNLEYSLRIEDLKERCYKIIKEQIMKVLILSCSTGGGHNSCARYIKEELDNNNIESVFMDFYDIVNKKAKKVAENIYLKTLNGEGKYFRMFYKLGEMYSNTKIKSPVYLVNKFHKKKLYEYIKDNNFDLVITTHLFPSLTLTAINKNKEKVKFITIATDYEPCPFLEESKPNYLIMQKDLEERFIKKGFDKDILVNTGIPISSRFICDAKNIRDKFNIKEEKLILIMLGSMGFGNINSIIDDISKINNIKIIIVCGSNKKLYNELSKMNNDKLIILGFVNNINDLIYSADIVMSKPGGLSSTEITSLRKPLLHIFPIPGIETYNTNFFLNHKMSLKCENKEEIITNLNKLINDNDLQKEMIKNQEKYINKYSGADLVKLIKEKMSIH